LSCGIYKITNKINGQSYIGQSIALEQRIRSHKVRYHTPSDAHYNSQLYADMRDQGIKNFIFEIIEECSPDLLNEREKYWIKYFDTYKKGYNKTFGGENYKINHDEVMKLYDTGQYSNQEIAEIVGAERRVIGTIIKSKNLKAHYYLSEDEIKNICKEYTENKISISELSKRYKRDRESISRVLKNNNIQIRRCGAARATLYKLFDNNWNLLLDKVTAKEICKYLKSFNINAFENTIKNSAARSNSRLYGNYHVTITEVV